ncbi:MAG: hypothetical protein ACLQED_03570 [Desulfobaccales bacterium]
MMEDEKRISLGFECPKCHEHAERRLNSHEIETALEVGEIDVACIKCSYSWEQKLEPQHRKNLKISLGLLKKIMDLESDLV